MGKSFNDGITNMAQTISSVLSTTNISMMASNSSNTSEYIYEGDMPIHASQLASRVTFVLLMIIGFLGIFGNVLSAIVFIKSQMSKTSVGILLIGVAIGDTIFLIGNFFIATAFSYGWITYQLLNHSNFLCKTIFYLQYASQLWVALQTLGLTLQRYMSVAYPLKLKQLNMFPLSRRFMAITFIFSHVVCSYALVFLGTAMYPIGPYCVILDEYANIFDLSDFIIVRLFADAIIGIFIVILTGLIIKALYKVCINFLHFCNNLSLKKSCYRTPLFLR